MSAQAGAAGPRRAVVDVTVVSSIERLLDGCLSSLFEHGQDPSYELRVHAVWNGAARGQGPLAGGLRARYPEVEWIENPVSGFSRNQNLMLRRVAGDYALVINDDLVFLPGSVDRAVKFMEKPENAKVGVLGIRLLNPDGSLQPSTYSFAGVMRAILDITNARRFIPLTPRMFPIARLLGIRPGGSRYWDHDKTCDVDTFRGAYILVRGAGLQDIGLLDELGGVETDWNYRFHRGGWRVVFFHEAEIIHLGSQTTSVDPTFAAGNVQNWMNLLHKQVSPFRFWFFRLFCLSYYRSSSLLATIRRDRAAKRNASRISGVVNEWPNLVDTEI